MIYSKEKTLKLANDFDFKPFILSLSDMIKRESNLNLNIKYPDYPILDCDAIEIELSKKFKRKQNKSTDCAFICKQNNIYKTQLMEFKLNFKNKNISKISFIDLDDKWKGTLSNFNSSEVLSSEVLYVIFRNDSIALGKNKLRRIKEANKLNVKAASIDEMIFTFFND